MGDGASSDVPAWTAAVPLGCYLLALGLVHLRRRPFVLSGASDAFLLAAGLSGLLLLGPLALVEPAVGGSRWGWPVLILIVALVASLLILTSRPRIVVYNATVDQLRPAVAEVALGLDASARWAGETVALPGRGLQIHLDGGPSMRTVCLVALGQRPSPEGWGEFSRRLRSVVTPLRVSPSPWSWLFIGLGTVLLSFAAWAALAGGLAG